jgi:hypothetical protein
MKIVLQRKITPIKSMGNSVMGELHYGELFVLPLGGQDVKHTVQREILIPNQHLLRNRGKPSKP